VFAKTFEQEKFLFVASMQQPSAFTLVHLIDLLFLPIASSTSASIRNKNVNTHKFMSSGSPLDTPGFGHPKRLHGCLNCAHDE